MELFYVSNPLLRIVLHTYGWRVLEGGRVTIERAMGIRSPQGFRCAVLVTLPPRPYLPTTLTGNIPIDSEKDPDEPATCNPPPLSSLISTVIVTIIVRKCVKLYLAAMAAAAGWRRRRQRRRCFPVWRV